MSRIKKRMKEAEEELGLLDEKRKRLNRNPTPELKDDWWGTIKRMAELEEELGFLYNTYMSITKEIYG